MAVKRFRFAPGVDTIQIPRVVIVRRTANNIINLDENLFARFIGKQIFPLDDANGNPIPKSAPVKKDSAPASTPDPDPVSAPVPPPVPSPVPAIETPRRRNSI